MAIQKARRVKHRKAVRKEEDIRLRVTADQKQTLIGAAERAGLGVGPWLLMLGLREAGADK
jgi:uncharacterized protein (DUF1778 family)